MNSAGDQMTVQANVRASLSRRFSRPRPSNVELTQGGLLPSLKSLPSLKGA